MLMGAEDFICLCIKEVDVKVIHLCTGHVNVKWYFLLIWVILNLLIINFVKVTLSGRTHAA